MLRFVSFLFIVFAFSAPGQDLTNSATFELRESAHRSFRIIPPQPGGLGPVVYRDVGRTFLSMTADLDGYDVSRGGTNSSIGIAIGDIRWEQSFSRDKHWQPGRSILHLKGHDFQSYVNFRSFTARWKGDQLRVRAHGRFWRDGYYGFGSSILARDYVAAARGIYTSNLPVSIILRTVADDTPAQTNIFHGMTNVPVLINVNTREATIRHETALHGFVQVTTAK